MLEYKEIFCKNRDKKILQRVGLFMDLLWDSAAELFLKCPDTVQVHIFSHTAINWGSWLHTADQ